MKLHDDDFFDEEDAEALRFDNFDDAVECCADLNIPFFVDAGNKKLVFWFVRVDDEGYPEIARCTERSLRPFLPVSAPAACTARSVARFTGRTESPALLMLPRFADIFQQGNRWLNWLEKQPEGFSASGSH
ncbi:IS91, orf2 [Escherichia coli]|nr:IS91, orf2 [Escherichia coli]